MLSLATMNEYGHVVVHIACLDRGATRNTGML
jgi:hypothetical protein